MSTTLVEVTAGADRARVTLRAGTIVPRLVSRGRSSAHVALVAGGALLLGGDAIDVTVVVGSGCSLKLEDIGGTVAYDGEGESATWDATVHVGEGASVTWHGLPFVVADGADVDRRTVVRLGHGGSVLLRETVVLGRTGERGGVVRTRTEVWDGKVPVLVEGLALDGHDPVPGVVGAARVLDTVLAVPSVDLSPVVPQAVVPQAVAPQSVVVLRPEAGGVLVRALGTEAHRTDLARTYESLHARLDRAVPTGVADAPTS